jgi:hypothetical protein
VSFAAFLLIIESVLKYKCCVGRRACFNDTLDNLEVGETVFVPGNENCLVLYFSEVVVDLFDYWIWDE